tara:strand:- start:1135 stop:1722 length:588 start_codon:yes stop_codon:yes gene_type:complete
MGWVYEQQKRKLLEPDPIPHLKYFKKATFKTFSNLYVELENLIETKKVNWSSFDQISINTVPGIDEDEFGCGSLVKLNKDTGEWETPYNEEDFTHIRKCFKGTQFEEVYNELKKHCKVGRVRLMKMVPDRVLPWHFDYNDRYHYPIKTQIGCNLMIENECLNIPQDEWWWTQTTKWHSAMNGSNDFRVHIVAIIL